MESEAYSGRPPTNGSVNSHGRLLCDYLRIGTQSRNKHSISAFHFSGGFVHAASVGKICSHNPSFLGQEQHNTCSTGSLFSWHLVTFGSSPI